MTISLPRLPPTRTTCTFDVALDASNKTPGDSVTLEWDPLQTRSLVRSATLVVPLNASKIRRDIRVGCHAEPARHAVDANVNYAWRPIGIVDSTGASMPAFGPSAGDQVLLFCDPTNDPLTACIDLADIRQDGKSPYGTTHVKDQTVKALVVVSEPPDLLDGLSATPAVAARSPLGPAARSFSGLSDQALGELFQVVAEVVLEKAKSKGLKLAQERLRQLVCQDLATSAGEILFPRTCDAVRSVRLDDLAGAGRQLLNALTQDLVLKATSVLTGNLPGTIQDIFGPGKNIEPVARELLLLSIDLAVDAAAGKQERLRAGGQRLVVNKKRGL